MHQEQYVTEMVCVICLYSFLSAAYKKYNMVVVIGTLTTSKHILHYFLSLLTFLEVTHESFALFLGFRWVLDHLRYTEKQTDLLHFQ